MIIGWRKLIAMTFLLWTLLDISVPGLCKDDRLPAPANGTASLAVSSSVESVHSQDRRPSLDEDCICCSTRVTLTQVTAIEAPVVAVINHDESAAPKPREYAAALYHPPRG